MNSKILFIQRTAVRTVFKQSHFPKVNPIFNSSYVGRRFLSTSNVGHGSVFNSYAYQNFIKPGLFTVCGIGFTYTAFILKQELSFERAINKYPEYFQKVLRYFNGNWNLAWNSYLEARGTDRNDRLYKLKNDWYSISEYNRTMIPLIGLNILVFLLWKVPRYQNVLNKFFLCRPVSSHYSSIFLSSFSHQDGWHIATNMFCLYSLAKPLFDQYGSDHFMAFYLSSAFFSGYLSYLFKFVSKSIAIGSLGASGAVYAVLAAAVVDKPDLRLALIYLPFFSFSGSTMLVGTFIFELFSLFFFNMGFDNAAHLSGLIYGTLYNKYICPELWTKYRHYLVGKYRSLVNFDYNLTKKIEKKKRKN